jgi:hypothetical protein
LLFFPEVGIQFANLPYPINIIKPILFSIHYKKFLYFKKFPAPYTCLDQSIFINKGQFTP